MKLLIEGGVLYADQLHFSNAEVIHDCPPVQATVEVRYSHGHQADRIHAEGLGWLGAHPGDAVVLGRVRGRDGLLPCAATEQRLVSLVDRVQDEGGAIRLEVKNG